MTKTIVNVWLGILPSLSRSLAINTVMLRCGGASPKWIFRRQRDSLGVYKRLIGNHYRFFQCAANRDVAI